MRPPSSMPSDPMKNWWPLSVRGIAVVTFGLSALLWPQNALTARLLVFAAYVWIEGIFNFFAETPAEEASSPLIPVAVEGLTSLVAGLVVLEWSGIAGLPLVFLIAAWSILRGTAEGLAALRLRKHLGRERPLAMAGILTLAGGLLAFVAPPHEIMLATICVGTCAVVLGGVMIALSLRVPRPASFQRRQPGPEAAAATSAGVVLHMADWRSRSRQESLVSTDGAHRPNAT